MREWRRARFGKVTFETQLTDSELQREMSMYRNWPLSVKEFIPGYNKEIYLLECAGTIRDVEVGE